MGNQTNTDPGLTVTEGALAHIRRSLGKMTQKDLLGIRVGVKKAGCSGYEYVIEPAPAQSQRPFDMIFTFNDIAVLVDKEIYFKFLKGGTVLDFQKEGLKEGLEFNNPNVAHQCGCGESFTLVTEADD
jgi:iron-sulfur cluster assembly accessory protein